MVEIQIIAPHLKIFETAKFASQGNGNIDVKYGLLEDAVPIALKAEANGAQVIISRGGTARLLENSELSLPIVDIPVSPYIMLNVIHKLQTHSKKITVMGSNRIVRGVEKLRTLLNVDLEIKRISSRNQAEAYVQARMNSNDPIKTLVGGAIAEALANEYDLPTAILDTGLEDIEHSIEEAERLLKAKQNETQKAEQLKAILNNINHGVIAVNKHKEITIFNKAAGKITGISKNAAEGKRISDILPQNEIHNVIKTGSSKKNDLVAFRKVKALSNKVPIKVNNEIVGAVETLEDITKIKEYEKIIRVKLAQKGHVAKFSFSDIIGDSPMLNQSIVLAKKFADVESNIVIEGESGVGKEVFAQAIHNKSNRRKGPFVAVNCGAIPDSLLESELFGYQSGAFSGAHQDGKEGLFIQAHTGTIFLDEISETTPEFQTKLLRVIQEMEVRPLGSDKVIPIDVRIITATNKRLKEEVALGNFRNDLYYRINILYLPIPLLRHRQSDIEKLSQYFIDRQAAKLGKKISISDQALKCLSKYSWPGNIRELKNIIERLCVIYERHIDEGLVLDSIDDFDVNDLAPSHRMDRFKNKHIIDVLSQCDNNKTLAAEKLGISRTTLWRELKSLKK